MIYSRSSEYAIRACVRLAQAPTGKCVMAKDIAREEDIPVHFLAKILQELARKGLLRSTKGPSGGFCLNGPARKLRLVDIVEAVDGLESYDRCLAGKPVCSDRTACAMHEGWMGLRSRIMKYLGGSSVGDLARASASSGASRPVVSGPAGRRRSARRV
jgi:Rrf2 family protein